MFPRFPAALLAAAIVCALQLAPVSVASAQPEPTPAPTDGTTWTLQPATPDGPDGRISLRHTVAGGDAVDDLVAVTNFSSTPARFALYASDGTITADGSFDLIPDAPTDGGSWIAIGAIDGSTPRGGGGIEVEVPAGASLLVPVTIDVPGNATPGDHPAGIVAELLRDDAGAVQIATRVGVRVHLRVTGDLVAELVPEGIVAEYRPSWNPFAPGIVAVSYSVSNSGNVRLGSSTTVTAAGAFGIGRGAVTEQAREVLPGSATGSVAELPVWPLFFTWGDVTATPAVVGEDESVVELHPAAAGFGVWTVPWSQLVLIGLLVGAVFLLRWLRSRSRAQVQARIDAAVAAATAGSAPKELGSGPAQADS